MNIQALIKKVSGEVSARGPEILIGTGIVGMISTAVMAAKATPRAMNDMAAYAYQNDKEIDEMTRGEKIEATWKTYAPTFGMGAVSTGAIIAGTVMNNNRKAAVTMMYAASESAYKEFRNQTEEIVGKEKVDEIREAVAKKKAKARIDERPAIIETQDSKYVKKTGDGDTLIFDGMTGRFFRSSTSAIERAVNHCNRVMMNDIYITLNEFHNELGLDSTTVGDMVGWDINRDMVEVRYYTDMDEDGQPYVILDYVTRPLPLKTRM